MKILVINLTRMGDILQTTPLLDQLKQEHSNITIHYLAAKNFCNVLKNIKTIDKIIEFDFKEFTNRSIESFNFDNFLNNFTNDKIEITKLQKQNYDLVINLTHTDESKALTWLIQGKESRGITQDKKGFRIINHPWANYFYNSSLNRNVNRINLVDIYLKLGNLKQPTKRQKIHFEIDNNDNKFIEEKLVTKTGYFCIQLGASVNNKQYPPENFAQLCNTIQTKYNLLPVFLGTEKELPLFSKVDNILQGNFANLMGKTTINMLAYVLKNAKFLLTNDTGTMHLAAAVQTPIICVALATAYSHETCSYSANNYILEADIICSPCSHHVKCLNPICKNMIKPKHLEICVESLLSNTKIESNIDNQNLFSKVRLFKTNFDKLGFLRLFPVIKKKITALDILNLCFHYLWSNSLGFKDYNLDKLIKYQNNNNLLEEHSIDIANELNKFYNSFSDFNKTTKLNKIINNLEQLIKLSKDGIILLNELIGFYKNRDIKNLKDNAPKLQIIDDAIIQSGYSNEILRPLTYQFQFGKENLALDDLEYLFKNTNILYNELELRSKVLSTLIRNVLNISID